MALLDQTPTDLFKQQGAEVSDDFVLGVLSTCEYRPSSSFKLAIRLFNELTEVQKVIFKTILIVWVQDSDAKLMVSNRFKFDTEKRIFPNKFPKSIDQLIARLGTDEYNLDIWIIVEKFRNKVPFITSFGVKPPAERTSHRLDLEIEVAILLADRLRNAYSVSNDRTMLISKDTAGNPNIHSQNYFSLISGEWFPAVFNSLIKQLSPIGTFGINAAYKKHRLTVDQEGLGKLMIIVIKQAFPEFNLEG